MTTVNLTQDQLATLLNAVMTLEHRTKEDIGSEGYQAIVALCLELKTPQFITEYFARKAIV